LVFTPIANAGLMVAELRMEKSGGNNREACENNRGDTRAEAERKR
jgi:hypothetical protein